MAPPLPVDTAGMQALLAVSRDALLLVRHADRRIVAASPSAERLYGMRTDTLCRQRYDDLVTDPGAADDLFERHREHVPLRYHRRADGSRFPVEIAIHWTPGPPDEGGELGYFRVHDLSRSEEDERRLRAAQAGYQAIFRAAPFPVLLLDRRGSVTDANEAALALYRHSSATLIGQPVSQLLQDGRSALRWYRAAHSRLPPALHRRCDGSTFLAEVEVSLLRQSAQVHAVAVVHDVTEAHDLLERVRASEARWRFALEGHGDVLWEWDLPRQRMQVSGELGEAAASPPGLLDVSPQQWFDRLNPTDRPRVYRALQAHLRGETPQVDVEARLQTRRQGERWVWLRGRVLERADDGRALRLLGSARDIHEHKQLAEELTRWREQVLHTSRITSMGEMAATLAHELNQPLTAIRNFSAAALRRLDAAGGQLDPQALRPALQPIADEAMRAGRILHHIHAFARKGRVQFETLSINELVAGFQRFAEMQAGRAGVHIDLALTTGLPPVQADRVLTEQLLFNLVRNGFEAMGVVTVPPPGEPPPPPPDAELRITIGTALGDDGQVQVSVADRGRGLPADLQGDIYAPFVSSKRDGLGMGLAICRSIVESHHGHLWASPNPGGGSVFHFSLPAAPEPVAAPTPPTPPTPAPPSIDPTPSPRRRRAAAPMPRPPSPPPRQESDDAPRPPPRLRRR